MQLTHLTIHRLRNLREVHVDISPGFNILYGQNGSGKTSFLEAIHYLGLGRSFRTHKHQRVIQDNADNMQVIGKLGIDNPATLGIGVLRSGEKQIRYAGEKVDTIAQIAQDFPVLLLHPNSHHLLTGGPKLRRQFIDWGVFHVEHSFMDHWQRARRALMQRNAALKQRSNLASITLWDNELLNAAVVITEQRQRYLDRLIPHFQQILSDLLAIEISLNFKPGWDEAIGLEQALQQSINRDQQLGYTQYGPHRADLQIRLNSKPAQDVLSQGQQKLTVYALRLAQGQLLQEQTQKTCLYLVDDMPAELDQLKQQAVLSVLTKLNAQVFITSVDKSGFDNLLINQPHQMFHVEHGEVFADKSI